VASLWAELKRRNVVRVAIAYAVVIWLVLQLTDVLVSLLTLPDWVGRFVFLLLLIGMPVVLFFAWAFEITPDGVKKAEDVERSQSLTHATGRKLDFAIIGILTIALAFFVVDKFVLESDADLSIASQTENVATEIQQSIAVLPFVNMSSDPEQEYFSDGLSEEILNLLAKIPKLKVIGRTSSFAFKGKNEDLRVIGQTLGVTTVLEGSVRKSGDQVRVTAQLIDVSDGSHLWSETYDRTLTDIFAIQDDVAAAIIDALQIHVGTIPTRGRPTENTEAYALFFQGRVLLNAKDLQNAEEIFLKVVELDPNFAEAYELLAFAYWEQSGWLMANDEASRLMGEAAAKALAINPDLAFAQSMLGSASNFSWLGEIQGLEQALREEPGKTEVVEALGWNLLNVGYLQEALGVAERYVDRDPLLPAANYWLANALYALGRTDEAIAAWERAAQLDHSFAKAFISAANLLDKQDDIGIAYLEAWVQDYGFPDSSWVRELVTSARDPETGLAYLDRRIPQIVASVPVEDAAVLQGFMNPMYQTFGYPDRSFEIIFNIARDSEWGDAASSIWHGTIFRRTGFTAHPKYLEAAEANGFIELWEQRGPPDFCEKKDGDWVCQ
jgi:TolB-like protein/Tfp pilus assembly protein PilF